MDVMRRTMRILVMDNDNKIKEYILNSKMFITHGVTLIEDMMNHFFVALLKNISYQFNVLRFEIPEKQ